LSCKKRCNATGCCRLYDSWLKEGLVTMDREDISRRIQLLRQEHRDLDAAIDALGAGPGPDQLQIARLKKRKLRLRDEITLLEDQLIPDIIA